MQAHSPQPAQAAAPRRARGGRPSAEKAGDVDRRILDAATRLFLRHGFDATNCDQVAVEAGAGKASIYARYANKEALFAAVVRRKVEASLAPSEAIPVHLPLVERLRVVGGSVLTHALAPEAVALMRVVIATAYRMPDLARLADGIGREQGVERMAQAIAGRDADAPGALERARPVAAKFIDLVFTPCQMRALIGDDPGQLHAQADASISEATTLLSKGGWLDSWA
jgi:AcrR family transcriptional regulator